MIRLDALTKADLPLIVEWRKANPEGARTPTLITLEQEEVWYASLQEPGCKHRYWAVREERQKEPPGTLYGIPVIDLGWTSGVVYSATIGLVGLTYIDPDNRRAEVAILINPALRGKGLGTQALMLVLAKGFDDMDLAQIYGEVYHCNQYLGWWEKLIEKHAWYAAVLPDVKRRGGRRWDATWFAIGPEHWSRMRG